ncbi:hypothetical protein [Rhizobium sp. RM]|jgi:hypothetical protein|uniref:hypothetical protein n=1 Tax=Rhizobium sp. RM TaxID=2748079 RepID=UPI00110F418D|nr:hypothetical protein [Rhizobium sp. RM]NWJ23473.1 hypothetical protein [Rhizobium sp. RM]TMV19315.1 hypothetical protein BJG94_14570 [Rhizobium sp. Td3]
MSHTPGVSGDEGHEAEENTASALLSLAAPSLAPNDDMLTGEDDQTRPTEMASLRPERSFPKASWLDALPSQATEINAFEPDRISSVNSDDNGLYRMFIGISP